MKHIFKFLATAAVMLLLGVSNASALDLTLPVASDTIYNPDVIYSPMPRSYEIAGIDVKGVNNVDDYVIIGYSGL